MPHTDYDVVIVGAGAAGLMAAQVLGRCLRKVLVLDGGPPRNAPSPGLHGFLSRDGVLPEELLRIGRQELENYKTVELRKATATDIQALAKHFRVTLKNANGHESQFTTRKVLLATGVQDVMPPVEGAEQLWGTGVLHCPYCHGYEVRNEPLAVWGRAKLVTGLALLLSRWTDDVVICVEDPQYLTANARRRLKKQGIKVYEEPVVKLEGTRKDGLKNIVFANGEKLARKALFIHAHQNQGSPLAEKLQCRINSHRSVWVDKHCQTTVPGIYAAGDNTAGPQQAIVAAGEGSTAAYYINESLTREECPK